MAIALVTDSTACVPQYWLADGRVRVVPVQVVVGDYTYAEGDDINTAEVVAALNANAEVTTSRPAPAVFESLYRELAGGGAEGIVSIHLSSELSGTYSAAVLAARATELPVQVVDSRTVGLGLGFAVMAAASAAAAGAPIPDVIGNAGRVAAGSRSWLCVETLEHLRRGGRIGLTQTAVGSALSIKPILEVSKGRLVPLEKVRTTTRAHDRLIELAASQVQAGAGRWQIGVQHAAAPERAEALAQKLGKQLPGVPVVVADLGAVLTAHVGPGAVSVTVAPV